MEYKEHPNYPLYLVREDGVIFSKKTGKELFKQKNNSGYWISHFHFNGKRKAGTVHRLVAETWVDNPENKPQVNHDDGNKNNCHPSNLKWSTGSENMLHAFANGLNENARKKARQRMSDMGRKNAKVNGDRLKGLNAAKRIPIKQLDLNGNFIKEFESMRAAAKAGFNNIHKVLKGDYETSGGYRWKR